MTSGACASFSGASVALLPARAGARHAPRHRTRAPSRRPLGTRLDVARMPAIRIERRRARFDDSGVECRFPGPALTFHHGHAATDLPRQRRTARPHRAASALHDRSLLPSPRTRPRWRVAACAITYGAKPLVFFVTDASRPSITMRCAASESVAKRRPHCFASRIEPCGAYQVPSAKSTVLDPGRPGVCAPDTGTQRRTCNCAAREHVAITREPAAMPRPTLPRDARVTCRRTSPERYPVGVQEMVPRDRVASLHVVEGHSSPGRTSARGETKLPKAATSPHRPEVRNASCPGPARQPPNRRARRYVPIRALYRRAFQFGRARSPGSGPSISHLGFRCGRRRAFCSFVSPRATCARG